MSLELKNISKKYKGFSLQNINIRVETGEYFVLLGRSGAGKSVIMEIIAGFKQADSGEIILNGENISNKKIQKRNIAIVFQDLAAFPHMTVRQNIEYPIKKKKKRAEINEIVNNLAKELNIEHILDKKPPMLSGGEVQRTVLARTLASEPELLLLDEPLSALDVQLKSETRNLLKSVHKKGITIIHITHDFDEAVRLADKVAIINNGKILQQGSVKEVFSRPKSKFAANLAGINNFFKANLENIPNSNTKKATVNENVHFWILTNEPEGFGFVIIQSHDVILTAEKHLSSARNMIQGTVIRANPAIMGIEVEIDIGVKISALVTEASIEKMDIKEGKNIWVSFKASATKFIKV